MRIVAVLAMMVAAAGLAGCHGLSARPSPVLSYHVVAQYPHDVNSFTEGLAFDGQGRLIESIGLYGQSALMAEDLQTGKPSQTAALERNEFGEGVTVVGDRIVQLTWQNGVGHVYDAAFNRTGRFLYQGEGWGLTYDGSRLIRSDGSSFLHFLDPQSYAERGHIQVREDEVPMPNLNELEYANGRIYANVWHKERIAVIVPETGQIEYWIDLHPVIAAMEKPDNWNIEDDVLNGIAYQPQSGHLFVTGKCWPLMFEIELDPR
jgi:glutaminyl-peptide cyclotransferase